MQLTVYMWVCESVGVEVTVAMPPALMAARFDAASVIMCVTQQQNGWKAENPALDRAFGICGQIFGRT